MCILSYGLVYVKKYNCKNVTYNLTGKCSLTNVADLSLNHVREHNFLFVEFANFNNVRTFALCFS